MKFKRGDEVLVTAGKDRGKRGKVEKVFPRHLKVLVSGLNVFKRHLKAQGPKKPGGIVEIIKPLPLAKVALFCPKCAQPTRVGYRQNQESKKRICRKCGEILDK